MSMHEWNEVMYGVEFDFISNTPITNYDERVFNFLINHRDEISEFTDFPTCPEEVDYFVEYYEDNYGNFGIEAIVGDIISKKCPALCVTTDDNAYAYAGVFAVRAFPWQKVSEHYNNLTAESVEEYIRPIFIELYGECPEFKEHVIWYCG